MNKEARQYSVKRSKAKIDFSITANGEYSATISEWIE